MVARPRVGGQLARMGQKVHPLSFRLGITEDWRSRWYANKREFATYLVEDQQIRRFVKKNYKFAGIPRIDIERTREEVRVKLFTARPGIIIGRKGAEVERLRDRLEAVVAGRKVAVDIQEISRPELNAQLVAENVAEQLEKRASFRRTIRRAAEMTMDAGSEGVRIQVAGRLGGSEMARREHVSLGRLPLHTIQAPIHYGFAEAATTYGHIGVKCWLCCDEDAALKKERPNAAHAQAGQVPKNPAR